jgi:hypothetical protein
MANLENTFSTVTEAGPTAFAHIQENYYYVFVGCTVFFFTIAYFYFPYVSSPALEGWL